MTCNTERPLTDFGALQAIQVSMNVDNMSYDELYDLFGGPAVAPGVAPDALKRMPTFTFHRGKTLIQLCVS